MMWPRKRDGGAGGNAPPGEEGGSLTGPLPPEEGSPAPAGERMLWRRRPRLFALLVVVAVAVMLVGVAALPGVIFPHRDKYYILEVDYSAAGTDVNYLTTFGPRLTGTPAEGLGADYIAVELEKAGLSGVEIEEYNVTCYEVERALLHLVQYNKGGLTPNIRVAPEEFVHKTDFTVGAYSGSRAFTRWIDDLAVADVGNGSLPSDWGAVSGRAAIVTNDGGVGNTQLYLTAWENGASALLIHNQIGDAEMGYPAIAFSLDTVDAGGHAIPLPDNYSGSGPDIPCLMVSRKTGDVIKDGMETPCKVRMDIRVTIEKRPCRVVVGERRGAVEPGKVIMFGAHHDTVYTGPGAVDNTVGVASVLAIAREIGKLRPAKTVRFATFGGEEEGILGSYEYFKAHRDELKGHLEMFLNLDMSHVDNKRDNRLPIVVSDARYLGVLEEIRVAAYARLPQLSAYNTLFSRGNLTSSSDMATFALEGYKVASCWGSGCWEYHTPKDTAERINTESFLLVGAVYGSFGLHLASGRT